MKKNIFILLLAFTGIIVHAQESGKANIFLGIQSGLGKIEDLDIGDKIFYQEYAVSTEIESAKKHVSLRLLPAFGSASRSKTIHEYGYTNSFSTDYFFYDFSLNVRFSAPVQKFRFSFEFGPGVSCLQKNSRNSTTKLDYYGKSMSESHYSTCSLFSSNFGTNVSYDCSSHIRVWLGAAAMFRINPVFWDGDLFGAMQVRLGVAWRFGPSAIQ